MGELRFGTITPCKRDPGAFRSIAAGAAVLFLAMPADDPLLTRELVIVCRPPVNPSPIRSPIVHRLRIIY